MRIHEPRKLWIIAIGKKEQNLFLTVTMMCAWLLCWITPITKITGSIRTAIKWLITYARYPSHVCRRFCFVRIRDWTCSSAALMYIQFALSRHSFYSELFDARSLRPCLYFDWVMFDVFDTCIRSRLFMYKHWCDRTWHLIQVVFLQLRRMWLKCALKFCAHSSPPQLYQD